MGNNFSDSDRQAIKEKAILLALQSGMALTRRDLEVWGMQKNGSSVLISRSTNYDSLWSDAYTALLEKGAYSISPRVGVGLLVYKNGKILLGKRTGDHVPDVYAGPGGHLEYHETFDQCVRREVKEETGIEVNNIRFLCFSNWRDVQGKHYVNFGFTADWVEGEPQVYEPDKCRSWNWYSPNSLPSPLMVFTSHYLEALKTGKVFFEST